MIVVDGSNTADKSGISQEAKKIQYVDSDKDGASHSLEDYIGTNKYNKDTDGDGKTDGYELSKYSDPLGSGELEYEYSSYGFMFLNSYVSLCTCSSASSNFNCRNLSATQLQNLRFDFLMMQWIAFIL